MTNTKRANDANGIGADEPRLVGCKIVEEITGLSRWTLWRLERDGAFPKPIRIRGEGTKRLYVLSEVRAWVTARLAERD